MFNDTTSHIRADRVHDTDTLVGDDGGHARVYGVTLHRVNDLIVTVEVATEFGNLYYAPHDELEVLDS